MEEYEALKKAAKDFNASQSEEEMIIGQPLEGEEAVQFIQWLMDMSKQIKEGKVTKEQFMHGTKEWVIPDE